MRRQLSDVALAESRKGSGPGLLRFGLSTIGYVVTAVIVGWSITSGWAGHDAGIWHRVGNEIWAGQTPYHAAPFKDLFFYAPPWALAFALVSWVPTVALAWGIGLLELGAARILTGSWLSVGFLGLLPVFGYELASAQWNLVLGLAVAYAISGEGRPAAWMALAKLSPILAVRDMRRVALFFAGIALVTLPWAGLWLDWIRQLVAVSGSSVPPFDIVPYPVRLTVAIAIILGFRTRLARGFGAIIAIPGFYWISFIVFAGLIPELQGRTLPLPHFPIGASLRGRFAALRVASWRSPGNR
jgi:hypothetical protein